MGRGAALNWKIVHNWDEKKLKHKKSNEEENSNE